MIDDCHHEESSLEKTYFKKKKTLKSRPNSYSRFVLALFLFLIAALVISVNLGFGGNSAEAVAGEQTRPGMTILERGSEFSAIMADKDTVYAGGVDGLYIYDLVGMCLVRHIIEIEYDDGKKMPLTIVKAIFKDRNGDIWIGHQNGLSLYKGSTGIVKTYTLKDGLPDNRINCVVQGGDGAIWAGTFKGAAVLRDGLWSSITVSEGLIDDNVHRILVTDTGQVWFGSYTAVNGGITIMDALSTVYHNAANGLSHNSITSITGLSDRLIWTGGGVFTEGGADRFILVDGSWKINRTLRLEDGLAGAKVRHIYRDSEGMIWFCSEYDGIAVFDADTVARVALIDVNSGLSDNEVKDIAEDLNGNLWLATRRGITVIEAGKLDELIPGRKVK